jgi:hypothetical protein
MAVHGGLRFMVWGSLAVQQPARAARSETLPEDGSAPRMTATAQKSRNQVNGRELGSKRALAEDVP